MWKTKWKSDNAVILYRFNKMKSFAVYVGIFCGLLV